jgi:hypothetical protein
MVKLKPVSEGAEGREIDNTGATFLKNLLAILLVIFLIGVTMLWATLAVIPVQ